MEAQKLSGLEPKSVFTYFEKLCSIPHGSGNTKMISDYIVSFINSADVVGVVFTENVTFVVFAIT